jgi:hypothetical protein
MSSVDFALLLSKGKAVPENAVKTWGSGDIAVPILNPVTRWKLVVSLTPGPMCAVYCTSTKSRSLMTRQITFCLLC